MRVDHVTNRHSQRAGGAGVLSGVGRLPEPMVVGSGRECHVGGFSEDHFGHSGGLVGAWLSAESE